MSTELFNYWILIMNLDDHYFLVIPFNQIFYTLIFGVSYINLEQRVQLHSIAVWHPLFRCYISADTSLPYIVAFSIHHASSAQCNVDHPQFWSRKICFIKSVVTLLCVKVTTWACSAPFYKKWTGCRYAKQTFPQNLYTFELILINNF